MEDITNATDALLSQQTKKTKGKKSEPQGNFDLIVNTATELENLSREEALELIPTLVDSVDFNYFKLGGVLAVVQGHDSWFKDLGYDTFRAFIEAKFGLHYRKAMYLISIYGALVESGVAWGTVGHLGWSKLKEIAPILTIDNAAEWVAKAEELSVLQLHEAVKKAQMTGLDKTDTTPDSSGVTTFTAKVHPDQKENINLAVEKAMKEANTEFKGVALEAIALNYLSGAKVQKPKSLAELLQGYTWEEVLTAFSQQWPNIDVSVSV